MFKVGDKVRIIASKEELSEISIDEFEFSTGTIHAITIAKEYGCELDNEYWFSIDMIELFDDKVNKENDSDNYDHYNKSILGKDGTKTTVDVYRVLEAFNVTNPQLQHIVKKALCAGQRGHKDYLRDLQDIVDSAKNAIEMEKQKGDSTD